MTRKILFALALIILTHCEARSQWVEGTIPYNDYAFLSLAVMGDNLIAICGGEVFRSTGLGETWLDANNGIEFTSDALGLFPYGPDIFVGTIYKTPILISTDTGQSWQPRNKDYFGSAGTFIALGGDTILASAGLTGLYRTIDTGMTWTEIPWGPNMHILRDTTARAFAATGGYVFVGSDVGGVFRSNDGGTSWQNVLPLPGRDNPVLCLAAFSSYLFAGTSQTGIFRSSNYGVTWDSANMGLPSGLRTVQAFITTPSAIYAGLLAGGGVFRSTDSGATWEDVSGSMTGKSIECIDTGLGFLFVGWQYGLWRRPLSDFGISSVASQQLLSNQPITTYPNPFSQSTQITFTSETAGYADVSIVNLLGDKVAHVFSGELSAGEHELEWDATSFPPGMYECVIRMNGNVQHIGLAKVSEP